MTVELPVSIDFDTPAGWVSAPPAEVGAPQAAYVLLHPGSMVAGSVANITISGSRVNFPAAMDYIADAAIEDIRQRPDLYSVELVYRRPGLPDGPSMLEQAIRLRQGEQGEHQLQQLQIFLVVPYPSDASVDAVVNMTLTANPEQWVAVVGDFLYVVYTVLTRTLGVKLVEQVENVEEGPVVQALSEAADIVHDIALADPEWVNTGWETVTEQR